MHTPYVFGIGFPKTATTSLAAALNCLGIPTLHTSTEPKGEIRLHSIIESNMSLNRNLLDPIDQKWQGFTDFWGDNYYETLYTQYPDSVFIYTKREFVPWFESSIKMTRYIYPIEYTDADNIVNRHIKLAKKYFQKTEEIQEFFRDKSHRYLELDICDGDGWEKLCEFLNLPVPDQPFPYENKSTDRPSRSDYKQLFARRNRKPRKNK
jgi:hypothetical protein